MVFCSASSGGSSLSYRPFFSEIESGRIKTIDEVKTALGIVCSEKILGIIRLIIPELRQRGNEHLIGKILQLTKNDTIHDRLVAILRENGLVSEKSVSRLSETKPFSPLHMKISGRLLKPNTRRVDCLDQNRLRDGNNTCGFHSLKNAIGALAVKNHPKNSSTLFTENGPYFLIKEIVEHEWGKKIKGDASIAHLRKAWEAICENKMDPFYKDSKQEWNKREISFFNSAGDELMIADSDSIDSLANLKQLTQTPGPCHHAFIVGSLGHWITIVYEKDPQENVLWYGFDSISDQKNDFFILVNIQKISEAMARINELIPKLYHKSIGFGLEQLAAKIGNEEGILLSQKEENLRFLLSATQFMHEIGWLDHPLKDPLIDHFIHTVKILLQFYREKSDNVILLLEIQQDGRPLNPFDHALSLFNLCTPNPQNIETFCDFEGLEQSQKCTLLKWINALSENERVKRFEQLLQLLENGYLPLIEKVFTQGNRQENWELVNQLIKMKVLPFPEDQKECIPSFIEQINFNEMLQQVEQLHQWLLDPARKALRKDIILRLSYELDNNSNPYEVRELASLLEHRILLFSIEPPEPLDRDFQALIANALRLTTDHELTNPNNCYHRYKTLEKIRSEQSPREFPILYKGREYFFQLSKKEMVFHRSDIPHHLNRDRLVAFFDGVEKKMGEKQKFAQKVHAALAENYNDNTTYSAEECLKVFLKAKRNFLEDPYIHSLTQLPQDPNTIISINAFYFYSLFNYWLSLNVTAEEKNSLSEQELVILSNAKEIEGCGPGKGEKIKNEYAKLSQSSNVLLPHPGLVTQNLRSSEGEKRKERLLSLFSELYKKYGEKVLLILHSEAFIKDLLGYQQTTHIKDPTHLQRHLINRFGILVGAPKGLEFDRYYIDPNVFAITDKRFLETFFKHAKPLLEELPQMLEEELARLNAILKENNTFLANYNSRSITKGCYFQIKEDENRKGYAKVESLRNDIINELGKEDVSLFERTEDPEFDWNTGIIGDETIEKVKPEALLDIFSAIGILRAKNPNLKINPNHPLPLKSIITRIEENRPLHSLDLSGCTWLTYDNLRLIITAVKDLDILDLSDCIQFTNKEMDKILALCGRIKTVNLSRCVQLSELEIPIHSKLILDECRINKVISTKVNQEDIKLEIPLESGKDYSNKKEFANYILEKFPELVSSCLHGLGFKIDEAIDFCILHKLENIDLTQFCSSITNEHIAKLSNSNHGIKKIAIYSHDITDDAVIQLAVHCKGLTSINLVWCRRITDTGLKALANHCKELTSIHLSNCNKITDTGLTDLTNHCKGLTSIDLRYCEEITNAGITALAENCNRLTSIHLSGCKQITDAGLIAIAMSCKGLTEINVNSCNQITDTGITALANHCKELTSINLAFCDKITDEGLIALAMSCKGLTKINVNDCNQITDTGITALTKGCNQLTSIILTRCNVTDAGLIALASHCHQLASIYLSGCNQITDEGLIAFAMSCNQLDTIYLSGCLQITEAGLIAFARSCNRLTEISLNSCNQITDTGIKALANHCNRLTSINLSGCNQITDEGLIALADRCNGLTVINLYGCDQITDVGLKALAISCNGLTWLNLSRCKVADEGLIALANHCNELTSIDLFGCDQITETGIVVLATHCNKLTSIDPRGCKQITRQAVETFAKTHPQLNIRR